MSILQIGCWILAVILAPCCVWFLKVIVPDVAKTFLEAAKDKSLGFLGRYTIAVIGVMSIAGVPLLPLLLYSKLILTALNK